MIEGLKQILASIEEEFRKNDQQTLHFDSRAIRIFYTARWIIL